MVRQKLSLLHNEGIADFHPLPYTADKRNESGCRTAAAVQAAAGEEAGQAVSDMGTAQTAPQEEDVQAASTDSTEKKENE